MVPHGTAFFIRPVLGEDAAQISLPGFGSSVGLFALASGQFLPAHGHPGAVAADVQDWRVTGARLGLALLPSLGVLAHPLHHALYLPGGDFDATSLSQVTLGLFISVFIIPFHTAQPCQSRLVAHFLA